ncbi:MAG: hypothetical protein KatS3mg043_1323 [Rhodothermaceae bacterium]|nr:MAG: hypothetical protein KatS3mg043_1323 [Rhodothermaceae bacterium]
MASPAGGLPEPVLPGKPPAAAPTIHVTIGRVVIRAVPPTPPGPSPEKPRVQPAVMTLDDYLKRRKAGGHA